MVGKDRAEGFGHRLGGLGWDCSRSVTWRGRCSEALQQAEVRQHAMALVFSLTAALAEHALARASSAQTQHRGLPTLHILCLWLTEQPQLLGCAPSCPPMNHTFHDSSHGTSVSHKAIQIYLSAIFEAYTLHLSSGDKNSRSNPVFWGVNLA